MDDLMSSRADLARRIIGVSRLTGQFRLRSGQMATTYFDKYLFESDPRLLRDIARALALLVPDECEVLAGLELGGVPIAVALSIETGLPAAFVRKSAKTYGTEKLAEGAEIFDRHVLVVEDVVTTGGQVVASATALREHGAMVIGALCVIDGSDGSNDVTASGLELRSLLRRADLDPSTA